MVAACSPCVGVFDCGGNSHAAVEGRILAGETGSAIAGVRVALFDRGDPADSAITTTDDEGLFSLSLAGPHSALSLRVVAPGTPGYVIDSLPCDAAVQGGDACVLAPITPSPWVPIHFSITYRGSTAPLQVVRLRFVRTGGSTWFGPDAADTVIARTDSGGIVFPFPGKVYASSLDPVVGDLTAELPGQLGVSVRVGFLVRPTHSFSDRPLDVFQMGPSLAYSLSFTDSATSLPVVGMSAEFTRTSGIAVDDAKVQGTSDAGGVVKLPMRALAVGTVIGQLVLRAPGASTSDTINTFELATFDNDSTRSAGAWRVGSTGKFRRIQPGP